MDSEKGNEKRVVSRLSFSFDSESRKAIIAAAVIGCLHRANAIDNLPSADWINTRRIRIIEYLRYVTAVLAINQRKQTVGDRGDVRPMFGRPGVSFVLHANDNCDD